MFFYMQMVYSPYTKLRTVHFHSCRGHTVKPYTIAGLLKENDGITVSRFGVTKWIH